MNPYPKLDPYEQDIENRLDDSPVTKSTMTDATRKKLVQAATNTIAKSQSITIRVNPNDIHTIKTKANSAGIPYQTLISSLIHHYATDKISLTL